jgi:hypothetical protein
MNWRFWIPLGCAVVAAAVIVPWAVRAASAGDGFERVVSSIEQQYHVRATRVPFIGLASFAAGGATHGGVGGIHIAEFENFTQSVDGDELNRMVEGNLGQGWSRFIRSTSCHGAEQTLIFARDEGSRTGLFILDLDGNEMNVVEVSVAPDRLNETIGKYEHRNGEEEKSN